MLILWFSKILEIINLATLWIYAITLVHFTSLVSFSLNDPTAHLAEMQGFFFN